MLSVMCSRIMGMLTKVKVNHFLSVFSKSNEGGRRFNPVLFSKEHQIATEEQIQLRHCGKTES